MFYSFVRREPEEYAGHNALAGSSYAMIYGVYLIMIATGLALYTVDASPASPFQVFDFLIPLFDGLQIARLIHHIGMWIVMIFAVMHIYFVILASIVERIGTFDSIISGYKFVSRRKTDVTVSGDATQARGQGDRRPRSRARQCAARRRRPGRRGGRAASNATTAFRPACQLEDGGTLGHVASGPARRIGARDPGRRRSHRQPAGNIGAASTARR